jgi:hypothetical protein
LPLALDLLLGPAIGPVRVERELPELTRFGLPPVFSFSPSPKLVKLLRGAGYDHIRYFIALPSYEEPRWLLPMEDAFGTLAGTEIYLPHRWAPRMLKNAVISMAKLGCVGWLRSRVLLASKGPFRLELLVHAVTGEQHPIFALSFGRQAAVRKLTVQVMRPPAANGISRWRRQTEHDILGYIKLPLTELANERVRHEAATLERLWNFPPLRKHIPRLLYAGKWEDTYVLFQSPLEGHIGPISLVGMHKEFLHALWSVQRVEKPGKRLIQKVAAKWEKAAPLLGGGWAELGRDVLGRATQAMGDKLLLFSVMHGDFAPWNSRVRQNELLLFDWESADWDAPTTWDISHFEVQTAFSLRKSGGHQTSCVESGGTCFMLYLLNSVCQFLEEGNHQAISYRQRLLTKQLQRTDPRLDSRFTGYEPN